MPITWQNVIGASLADASRPMEVAQRSLNGAFDGLRDVLKENNTVDASNWQVVKTNNTDAALNAINQYATPEEYQAALKSGAIAQLTGAYGAQVDQQAVRAAADQRLNTLQQRAKQEIEYNHLQTDERTQPLIDKFKAAELSGDKIGAAAAQAEYARLGGRNLADLVAFHDSRTQELTKRDRDTKKFDWEGRKVEDDHKSAVKDLSVKDANIAQSFASVRASDANVALSKEQLAMTKEKRVMEVNAARIENAKKALADAGNLYSEGVYNGKQSGELLDLMTKNGIGDSPSERAALIKRFEKGTIEVPNANGKGTHEVPIPMSAVKQAILGSRDQLFNMWDQGWANSAEKNLREVLKSTYVGKDPVTGKEVLKSKAAEDYNAFTKTIEDARNSPVLGSAGVKKKVTR